MTDLATLPAELVQQTASHAPISALVALKLTSKQLSSQLPPPPRDYIDTASECGKRTVRRYLAERRHSSDGRRTCILCGGVMPETSYRSRAEPICRWHEGWFERVLDVRALSSERNGGFTSRQGVSRTLCGHCKSSPIKVKSDVVDVGDACVAFHHVTIFIITLSEFQLTKILSLKFCHDWIPSLCSISPERSSASSYKNF
jgi:hypothetical protein